MRGGRQLRTASASRAVCRCWSAWPCARCARDRRRANASRCSRCDGCRCESGYRRTVQGTIEQAKSLRSDAIVTQAAAA
eukprot:3963517-Alexandrium_andersonii.AAC.1